MRGKALVLTKDLEQFQNKIGNSDMAMSRSRPGMIRGTCIMDMQDVHTRVKQAHMKSEPLTGRLTSSLGEGTGDRQLLM